MWGIKEHLLMSESVPLCSWVRDRQKCNRAAIASSVLLLNSVTRFTAAVTTTLACR